MKLLPKLTSILTEVCIPNCEPMLASSALSSPAVFAVSFQLLTVSLRTPSLDVCTDILPFTVITSALQPWCTVQTAEKQTLYEATACYMTNVVITYHVSHSTACDKFYKNSNPFLQIIQQKFVLTEHKNKNFSYVNCYYAQ